MPILNAFTDRLKALRGDKEVTTLANERGTSQPTIYKAEGGGQSVKWSTIEQIYGALCETDEDFAELLMLWALCQTDRKLSISGAREALHEAILRDEHDHTREAEAMLTEMKLMPLSEQQELITFTRHFRRSGHTRRIARVWVESVDSWLEEMKRQQE